MGQSAGDRELQVRVNAVEASERARPINAEILTRLSKELPKTLRYHTALHTDDVVHEALLFAVSASLSPRELELVALAAVYHDAGFIKQVAQNESIGATMALEAMTRYGGYQEAERGIVRAMIEDTQLKRVGDGFAQVPSTELSKYLCDADLSNLGRIDFLDKAELVREELGVPKSVENYERVLKLLQSHRWYTEPARKLRQEQKERNMAALQKLIAEMRVAK